MGITAYLPVGLPAGVRVTRPWRGFLGVAFMSEFQLPNAPDWHHPAFRAYAAAGLLHEGAGLADVVRHCRGRQCYLATPYSKRATNEAGDWDFSASLVCAIEAARWQRALAIEGVTAVSPIVQAVEMVHADVLDEALDPLDATFWESWCRPMLDASAAVILPALSGWEESAGIWTEVCATLHAQRPVFLLRQGAELGAELDGGVVEIPLRGVVT